MFVFRGGGLIVAAVSNRQASWSPPPSKAKAGGLLRRSGPFTGDRVTRGSRATAHQEEDQQQGHRHADQPQQDPADLARFESERSILCPRCGVCFHDRDGLAGIMPRFIRVRIDLRINGLRCRCPLVRRSAMSSLHAFSVRIAWSRESCEVRGFPSVPIAAMVAARSWLFSIPL